MVDAKEHSVTDKGEYFEVEIILGLQLTTINICTGLLKMSLSSSERIEWRNGTAIPGKGILVKYEKLLINL